MKDCLGEHIAVGDTVAIGAHWNGTIMIAQLDFDPEDPKYKKLRFKDADGHVFVMERKQFRLLNLTKFVQDNYANKDVVGDLWMR